MSASSQRHDHATALLAEANASAATLPRREQIIGWLQTYVAQEAAGDRASEAAAAENLRAIDAHLQDYGRNAADAGR